MRSFVNNQLGETWELKSDAPEIEELKTRSKDNNYSRGTCPAGGLVVSSGVDVQRGGANVHPGLYAAKYAWGRGMESWLVDWAIIIGNVLEQAVWDELDKFMALPIRHAAGGVLGCSAVSIDSSDGMTMDAVYRYVRPRKHLGYRAIKGSNNLHKEIFSPPSQAIDTTVTDRAARWGLRPYMVGVHKAQDLLVGRLKLEGNGPGRMHASPDAPHDYYEQLTSKILVPGRSGRLVYETKAGARAEWNSAHIYAMHGAHALRLHAYTDADWTAMEVQVLQRDLLVPTATQNAPVVTYSSAETPRVSTPGAARPFTGFGGGRGL